MLRRLLTLSIFIGGLVWLSLILAARLGDGPRPWPLELLDTFALYAFAPFVGLIAPAALLRSRLLSGLLLAAGLLFWQQFGNALTPRPTHTAPSGPGMRVLTYNVSVYNRDVTELASLVLSIEPDVVILQELTARNVEDLKRLLGDQYPFLEVPDARSSNDGQGIFSRLPIFEALAFRPGGEGYAVQQVRLVLADRPVSLFNVHLPRPALRTAHPRGSILPLVRGFGASTRDDELEWLIGETAQVSDPFILAGDFNSPAGSRPNRRFPASWRDAFGQCGEGFGHTWPTAWTSWSGRLPIPFPLVRTDYVLSSPALVPVRAWVPWIDGSDHLPVVAELQLPAAP